ncbi:hypothetical protein KY329_01660 [Candidatus Woesearchaeota archaeon]|nr:hypothetical protein [Candidatus Woesearchaeota archaeon]
MKKRLLLFILVFALLSASAIAEDIGVSTYVVGLDKYDITTSEYNIDFILTLQCAECQLSDFEIMNGRIDSAELNYATPKAKQYRIYAHLTNTVELQKYPFDAQEITISFEHKHATDTRLLPLDYGTGVDPSVQFPGWKIQEWTAEAAPHYYPAFDKTYSLYTFSIKLQRENIDAIIKNFLPIILLILIIISTYILSTDKIELRIGIVSSVMITLVMLHLMMLGHLPPTSYLTFADKFMILTYIVLLFSFVINVVILRLSQLQKKKVIEDIHRKTRYSMMVIIPLLYVLFFILFL